MARVVEASAPGHYPADLILLSVIAVDFDRDSARDSKRSTFRRSTKPGRRLARLRMAAVLWRGVYYAARRSAISPSARPWRGPDHRVLLEEGRPEADGAADVRCSARRGGGRSQTRRP